MIEKSDTNLEKTVLGKMNCLLEHHWAETRKNHGFYFFYNENPTSTWDRVKINGSCIGRVCWNNLLQVVNAMAARACSNSAEDLYRPFRGLESRSLEELAVKVDLALQSINIEDDIHKHRILGTSTC